MFSSIVSRLIILLFGTLYPAYASYKAVRTKNVKEYVKWMMYWIVFALFTCAETFTDIFLCWFPFYYEIKIVMVLWLLSPATKGSSILYRKFVHPTLARRENEIDECIAKAREQGCRAVLNLGSKGVNYATTVIMQTAIKGGGGLVNQLKKSYSLSDLSCEEDGTMAITASSISKKEEVDGPTGVVLRSRRPRSTHDDVVRSVEDITAEEVPVFTRTSSVGSTTRTRSRLTGSTRRQPTAEEAEMLLQLLTSIPNFNLNNLLDVDQGEENTENVDVPIETNSNLNIEQTLNENTETCEEKKNETIIENESCNINENIDKEIKQEIEVPKSNDIEETNNTESSSSIVEQNVSEKISEKDNVSEPKEIPIETKTSNDLPVDDNTINNVPTQVEAKDNLKDISIEESIPSSSFIPTCVHQFENGCDSSNELDKEIVATTNTNSDTQLKDKRGGKYGKKAAPLRPNEVVLKSTENDSSKKKLSSKSFKDRSGSLTKIVNLPQKLLFWGHKKLHFSSSLIGIDSLDLDFDAMKRSKSEQNLNNCEKHD